MENKPTLSLKSSLSMKRGSMLQNVSTTITHVTNVNETKIVASDPLQALEEIIKQKKENEATIAELKEELKQVRIDKQTQLMLIEHLNQQNVVLVQRSHELEKEVKELRFILGLLQSEGESLKTDIENFKSWTKKLDWSTANIPDALTKHYEIKQVNGMKGTLSDGTPFTQSVQTVDNEWHGPFVAVRDTDQTVYRGNFVNGEYHGERNITDKGEYPGQDKDMFWMGKNLNKIITLKTDGGVLYKCADEEDKGVSVTVLTDEGQYTGCYPVKNGYRIWLYTYNDEISVWKVENDQTV